MGWKEEAKALIQSGVADPGVVAKEVMGSIPKKERDEMFFGLIRNQVRLMIHAVRSSISMNGTFRPKYAAISPKNISYNVNNEWKVLGDLSRDEVTAIAEDYYGRARANVAMAKKFERLGNLMDEYKAKFVRELPDEVFEPELELV